MRNDRLVDNLNKYVARSSRVLGVDKGIISKHLDVALTNIQNELDQKELSGYGVIPKQELEAILPAIQDILITNANGYIEWLVENMIRQFQTMLSKEIDRVSNIVVQQIVLNKDKELGKDFIDSVSSLIGNKNA